MERRETSRTAVCNVHRYIHKGEQYGSSLKNNIEVIYVIYFRTQQSQGWA